jgi:hypothetical protein
MIALNGTPSTVHLTVKVKRAGTGVEEVYPMVGYILPEPEITQKEQDNVSNTQHGE